MQNLIRDAMRDMVADGVPTSCQPILITGLPGVGKSYLERMICNCVESDFQVDLISTASFGIAAINAGGDTLSGLIKVNFMKWKSDDETILLQRIKSKAQLQELCTNLKPDSCILLHVDEISTVSPDYLAALLEQCQQARGDYDHPFGGLPVILMGDFCSFLQLKSHPWPRDLWILFVMIVKKDWTEQEWNQKDQINKARIVLEDINPARNNQKSKGAPNHLGSSQKASMVWIHFFVKDANWLHHASWCSSLNRRDSIISPTMLF